MNLFDGSRRPVILLGGGVRLAGAADLVPAICNIGVPVLTSWQGADLCDWQAVTYFGRPGVYGQRCANKVLAAADMVLAIGCRLCLWTVGYEGFGKDVRVLMVDVDGAEVGKVPGARWIQADALAFMQSLDGLHWIMPSWLDQCNKWRHQYPMLECGTHDDTNGYINSYHFMSRLNEMLKPDQVIVTDAGGACCSAFQMLNLKPPQRLITSGGLGEMGCGIPMAVGASLARDNGEVLCLVGDGAAMMNLQELQTIAHHKLPIKIIVFNNDGYGMIKATQKTLGYEPYCVDRATGVSMPNFRMVAQAFGFAAGSIYSWQDFERLMPGLMDAQEPCLAEVFLDPAQAFLPKLNPIVRDGVITSPAFDQLSPVI